MMNRIGNVLREHGVKKGDRVVVYMPVSPMSVAVMLACARIGAPHSVVFAGFGSDALASRIRDGCTDYLSSTLILFVIITVRLGLQLKQKLSSRVTRVCVEAR